MSSAQASEYSQHRAEGQPLCQREFARWPGWRPRSRSRPGVISTVWRKVGKSWAQFQYGLGDSNSSVPAGLPGLGAASQRRWPGSVMISSRADGEGGHGNGHQADAITAPQPAINPPVAVQGPRKSRASDQHNSSRGVGGHEKAQRAATRGMERKPRPAQKPAGVSTDGSPAHTGQTRWPGDQQGRAGQRWPPVQSVASIAVRWQR